MRCMHKLTEGKHVILSMKMGFQPISDHGCDQARLQDKGLPSTWLPSQRANRRRYLAIGMVLQAVTTCSSCNVEETQTRAPSKINCALVQSCS